MQGELGVGGLSMILRVFSDKQLELDRWRAGLGPSFTLFYLVIPSYNLTFVGCVCYTFVAGF